MTTETVAESSPLNRSLSLERRPIIGIDAGASLVKLAIQDPSDELRLERLPSHDVAGITDRVARLQAGEVCLTGCGAAEIAQRLSGPTTLHDEFAAWAAGARRLRLNSEDEPTEGFLLVSLGTGTSILRVDESSSQRVGGTALGGGTLLGLGCALTGERDFAELCRLASRGSRKAVDLVLADVYGAGAGPLPDAMTASNFGKLSLGDDDAADRADLAAGVVGLVAENIGLIAGQIAASTGQRRVFIGGSTLDGNPALEAVLVGVLAAFGCQATVLVDGEYTGAIGAIELQRAPA